MDLRDQLSADLREAMRARAERRKLAIRAVRAAIVNAEVESQRQLTDEEIVALIAREVRQREDSIAQFRKGGREDLVALEQAEIEALEGYLPRQLSADEIRSEAQSVIDVLGVTNSRDMGRVMGELMPALRGRADGRLVSQIVRELLAERG